MPKLILIDAVYPDETRVVICNNRRVEEFDYETAVKKQLKGNIYLAKVTRVEPSLQAAFVDYGGDKHGFLPFSEIHPDYYHLPLSDRDATDGSTEFPASEVTPFVTPVSEAENIGLNIRAITPPAFSFDDNEDETVAEALPEAFHQEGEVTTEGETKGEEHNILAGEESTEESENAAPADNDETSDHEGEDEAELISEGDALHDEALEAAPKRSQLYRQYKIQEVIKRNQIILVQVIKEERGNKGASLTSYISLAGRYCVLMPNSERQGGISRRISSLEDRKRLKNIVESLEMPEGTSVIVRTAGHGRNKAEIKRDYDYLVRLWNSIREHTLASKAPAFIHAEGDLIKRSIRDMYDAETEEVLVQGEKAYRSAKDFMKMIMPTHASKVKLYKSKTPIFCRYQVDDQLSSLYSPIATLDSGGYIVINPTEALISIDVNSGRSTSERNIEETATKTNLEAAAEIARQLRMRDFSGLIVIDFIDMAEQRNRRAVEKALKEALASDRAKIQVGRISLFGLLEMSRQRLRSSFMEANMVSCPHCTGRGMVRASESTAIMALRAIESEIYKGDCEALNIYAAAETVMYVLNNKRHDLAAIEERYDVRILFHHDPHASADSFSTEKIRRVAAAKLEQGPVASAQPYVWEEEAEEGIAAAPSPAPRQEERKKNWRRKGNNANSRQKENSDNAPEEKLAEPVQETPQDAGIVSIADEATTGNGRRSSRRRFTRRGGRRNGAPGEGKAVEENSETVAENATPAPSENIVVPMDAIAEKTTETESGKPARRKYRYKKPRGEKQDVAAETVREEPSAPAKEAPESLLKELWKRIIE